MANRRMFSKDVTESDEFLDLTASAQCLYLHLCMVADDDGFIDSPKRTIRCCRCTEEDMYDLEKSGFVIIFERGIVVITDWHRNNQIQKDRYKATYHKEEKELLILNDVKRYESIL